MGDSTGFYFANIDKSILLNMFVASSIIDGIWFLWWNRLE